MRSPKTPVINAFFVAATLCVGVGIAPGGANAADIIRASFSPAPQAKTGIVQQTGAGARVAFSDKLRMYSQRMVSSACTLGAGVATDQSRGYLGVAAREFRRILAALEDGDRALGIIGAEADNRTLSAIRDVNQEWLPMDAIVQTILRTGATPELVRDMARRNAKLMETSQFAVSVLSNQYSDPTALLLSDAIRLQIAGRQRMLTQKLSFDACMLQSGDVSASERASLQKTIDLFEASLRALRFGLPEAGVYAATNKDIQAGLTAVAEQWRDIQWPLRATIAGAAWDAETRAAVYTGLNELMHEMDKVVVAYTAAAKLNI